MMYNQKLAAAIKVNGKVLREFKDQVLIPFGSEYSVLIKNLHTRRAIVTVYIDGEDQTPGGLVIDAGREVTLERGIKNNNLTEGNKFKFIERTSNIEAHRGIKLEDGIVRIEFEFEREYRPIFGLNANNEYRPWNSPGDVWLNNSTWGGPTYGTSGVAGAATNSVLRGTTTTACASLDNMTIGTTSVNTSAQSYNDAGITVAGSKSDQQFKTVIGVYGDGAKHNIVLKLLGETPDNRPVVKEVTVRHKPKCTTCGRQNKHNAKYCVECGTALEIFA
jgi:hypothetical protein